MSATAKLSTRPTATADPVKRILTETEASAYDGMSVAWHRKKRLEGGGPPYLKIGRSIRYESDALDSYFAARRVSK